MRTLGLAALLAGMLGAVPSARASPPPWHWHGVVRDAKTHAPLRDAEVAVFDDEAQERCGLGAVHRADQLTVEALQPIARCEVGRRLRTDARGRYQLEVMSPTVALVVQAAGHRFAFQRFRGFGDDRPDFELAAVGSLRVVLKGWLGAAGAPVRLSGTEKRQGTTDAHGVVLFEEALPGPYEVDAEDRQADWLGRSTLEKVSVTVAVGARATATVEGTPGSSDVRVGLDPHRQGQRRLLLAPASAPEATSHAAVEQLGREALLPNAVGAGEALFQAVPPGRYRFYEIHELEFACGGGTEEIITSRLVDVPAHPQAEPEGALRRQGELWFPQPSSAQPTSRSVWGHVPGGGCHERP